jgi:beta-galactosidase
MFNSKFILIQTIAIFFCFAFASCKNSQNREIISLNGQWDFFVDSTSAGNSVNWGEKGLPGKLIRTVSVPHAWNAEKGMEKYWGKCWYERKFEVSKKQLLKTTRLQFDAVYHDAIIYINDKKAGEHTGSGYNRFFVNISPYLKAGINTLTVSVDNSPSRSNIPFLKSYDWANDGGIYRNVYEIITDNQAIRNIHVVAIPYGDKGLANINVSFIDTSIIDRSKLILKAIITEENQPTHKQIFKGELNGKYEIGSILSSLNFDKINPWHFDSPSLYKLSVQLLMDGVEKDEYTTVFGFRSIKVENNRYILNGEPIRLMGVEWMPGSTLEHGMAETPADFEKNLNLMKNANCIFTRFHWQQDEYIFDWCDRHGMLIQEEIPYWGGNTLINDTLLKKGLQHLDEMTDAHFNHPSIILWGIGNELQSHNPINKSALKTLYNHAKSLDSSRLVSYVSNNLFWSYPSESKEQPDATSDFDMMMFNEYFSTWYNKSVDVVPGELDRIASEYPDKPLTISEWGLCEPVHKGGDVRRAKEMVQQITIYSAKSYIAGAIYFCLNDYRTHMGEDSTYSYPQRVHGVCDIKLNAKQSYDTLKAVSSPIEIKKITQKDGEILVTLFGKKGLPSYTIHNYRIVAGNEKVQINELKPSEEKTFEIKTDTKEFGIFRPTGFEVIHVKLR